MKLSIPVTMGDRFCLRFIEGGFVEHLFTHTDTIVEATTVGGICYLRTMSGETHELPIVSSVVVLDPMINNPAAFGGRVNGLSSQDSSQGSYTPGRENTSFEFQV